MEVCIQVCSVYKCDFQIKLASVKLAVKYMKRVSAELEAKLLINLFICCMFSSQEDLMQRQTCIYSR